MRKSGIDGAKESGESKKQALKDDSALQTTKLHRIFPGPLFFLSFCDSYDFTLYSIGTASALIAGVPFCGLDLIYGWWSNRLIAHNGIQPSPDEIRHASTVAALLLLPVIVMDVVLVALFFLCFNTAAARVARRMRKAYLAAIICREAYYFEETGSGEVASRLGRDLGSLETAIGEKLSLLMWSMGSLVSGICVSIAVAPKVGGVLFSLLPFAVMLYYLAATYSNKMSNIMEKSETSASTFLAQILASVRIVKIHEAEEQLVGVYDGHLQEIEKRSTGKSASRGFTLSTTYGALWLNYALAFFQGGRQVADGLKPGLMLNSFFSMFSAIFSVVQLLPQINDIVDAIGAQRRIKAEILHGSAIDIRDETGIVDIYTEGTQGIEVKLNNVSFHYRSRPTAKILDNFSATFERNSTTAIVGGSGSGKSTIAALLIRHYDLLDQESSITFNSHPVKDIQLRKLRSLVAVVSQECEIFSGSIFDNVAIGLTGTEFQLFPNSDDALRAIVAAKVEEAVRKAEAHEFISSLPEGLSTKVSGAKTTVLSGGQRQRLALARAFIRQPAVIILDESTSALDSQTEKKIQANLAKEQAERGLTMIIIAHRLSTCKDADKIIVMEKGNKAEEGSHDELLEKRGRYWRLIQHFKVQIGEEIEHSPEDEDATETIASLEDNRPKVRPAFLQEREKSISSDSYKLPPTRQMSVNYVPRFVMRESESTSQSPASKNHPSRRKRFAKYILSQKRWTLVGVCAAIVVGASFPLSAWLTGGGVAALALPTRQQIRSTTARYASYFLILSATNIIASLVEGFCLESGAQRLTHKLRRDNLHAILKQEVSWFEQEANASGSLASQVADHPTAVSSALGLVLGMLTHSTCNLLGAFILSFVLSWRIALVGFSTLALLIVFGWAELHYLEAYSTANSDSTNAATSIATEHVENIKTVAAFGREPSLIRIYDYAQGKNSQVRTRLMFLAALAFGLAQCTIFILCALIFRYGGGVEYANERVSVGTLYASFEAVTIAAFSASRFFSFIGDIARARASFRAMCAWHERIPPTESAQVKKLQEVPLGETEKTLAEIKYDNVDLVYPTRPGMKALDNMTLHIKPGQHVALCGPSGGGKSSFIATLSKFYDPSKGLSWSKGFPRCYADEAVSVDGHDLANVPDKEHFSRLAFVGQDSVLWEGTIRFNLTLGLQRQVGDDEIHAVIRDCALSDFVATLPLGIDTDIGLRGAQLSGGQKQRICIGRALLRHADMLLLDESTSALDIESEKMVQLALERASQGRTTVTVAHRLSTIRGADVIYVIEEGKIVESGTHLELIKRKARYFDLVEAQL